MAASGAKSSAPAKAQEEKKESKKKKSEGGEGGGEGAAAAEIEEKQWPPSRERKQVERYFEPYPQRSSAVKNPTIEQGPGKKLRDIPNVLFKLSKKKIDDNINVLHTILFGRKAHVNFLKRNILQFSGFVWAENEEKQKAKVKEKLDKCTKDKLLVFCQLFDLPINKAVTKKEEASTMLLEFLQSPYVSRDVVLAEKQGGKKRKRTKEVTKARSEEAVASDKEENKKQKRSSKSNVVRGRKESAKVNEDDKHGSDSGDLRETDNAEGKPTSRKKSSEKQTLVGATKLKAKISSSKKGYSDNKSTSKSALKARPASLDESKVSARSKKVSFNEPARKGSKSAFKEEAPLLGKDRKGSKSAFKEEAPLLGKDKKGSMSLVKGKPSLSGQDSAEVSKRVPKPSKKSASVDDSDSPQLPSKSRKVDTKKSYSDVKPSSKDKKASKVKTPKPNLSSKEIGKREVQRKAIKGPSRETMLPVVADILKEVDFEVVTLADILRKLESHFKVSLSDRKAEVKGMIEEIILGMPDTDDDEEDR